MNYSAWDKIRSGEKRKNPALSPGHVIIEFDRTKKLQIFDHKLGSVDFTNVRDINIKRQEVIDKEITNVNPTTGFRYPVVSYVHSTTSVTPLNETTDTYEVFAHGHPLGGNGVREQFESCTKSGLICSEGQGTNSLCNPGKCVVGYLRKINERKWKYTSHNRYAHGDDQSVPVSYFVPADKVIRLKTILRGNVKTLTEDDSSIVNVGVNKPASISSTIHLPPKFYFSDDFLDSNIVQEDGRLKNVLRPTNSNVGLIDRKENFVKDIVLTTYTGSSENFISSKLQTPPSEEVKSTLLKKFESIGSPWMERCEGIIGSSFTIQSTNLDYIVNVYDRIKELFSCVIQSLPSSFSKPKITYNKDTVARPVYSRLPGLLEGYRSDPAFSEVETPAQWLTSGVDEFLSKSKDSIASFYSEYLDPESCNPATLDWLAQHLGLFGDLWNEDWSTEIKRTLIRNAFGWWDVESELSYPQGQKVKTPKGEALEKYPFTRPEWVSSTTQSNLLSLKLDELETLRLSNTGKLTSFDKFKAKVFSSSNNSVLLSAVNSPKINKNLWNGLIEAKGSLLSTEFLCSTLGVKSHLPTELAFRGVNNLGPRSGLREEEFDAPIQVPYKYDMLQVGSETDASYGNFTNQLIAGVSRASTLEESRNVFFRMPFYYNRDGRSWDKMTYIAKNWMPSNLNIKIQYAYLSADLWRVGDAFFQPDIITEEPPPGLPGALIVSEDGQTYTTTEVGAPILYD